MRNVKTTKTGWTPAHTRGPIDRLGSAQWLHAESACSGWVMVLAEDRHPPTQVEGLTGKRQYVMAQTSEATVPGVQSSNQGWDNTVSLQ